MKKIVPTSFHSVTQLIIRLILLNVIFLLASLPVVCLLLFAGIERIHSYSLLFFLFSLPVAPASVALFRCTFSLIDTPEESVYKLFLHSYKQAYSKELIPLFFIHSLFFLLSFDTMIYALFPKLSLLSPFYFIIRFVGMGLYPIFCMEICLFKNPIRAVVQNGFILYFSKPLLILLTIGYFLFMLLMLNELPASLLFFSFSLFAYLYSSFNYSALTDRIAKSK